MNSTRAFLLRVTLAIVLIATMAPLRAEPMFVVDKLVLNVYAEPDQASERVATIETGDAVETLEQLDDFTRVRLADGREGWVGANYLTREAPAATRLQVLEKEQKAAAQKSEKQFKEQIADLQKQNAALQDEVKKLKEAAAKAPVETLPPVAEQPREVVEADRASPNAEGRWHFAWIWAPLTLLAAGAGYIAGYQTLARKIRKKFGGVDIYR